jgi:mono/diheme cytochrome c family protein
MRNRSILFRGLKCLTGALALITFGAGIPAAQAPATPGPANAADRERAFLKQYCVSCHNAKLRTGGLALDTLNVEDIPHSGETLEKVVRKVWGGSMPPAQAPHPDKQTVSSFLADLEGSLDRASAAHVNPGQPTMLHRMNRTEYLNAVHDLFDLELTKDDAALLPADDLSYGFDNNGDVLGMPPLLLERYLSIARRVSVSALGPAPGTEAPVNVYTQTVEYGPSQSKWSEGMPPGTRGGLAFDYHFPADGEYSIRVRLQRRGGRIAGFPNLNQAVPDDTPQRQRMVVGLDGKTIGLFLIGVDQTVVEKVPESEEGLADLPEPPLKELTRAEITNRGFIGDDNLEIKLAAKAGNRHLTAAFLARYVPVPAQLRDPLAAGQGADARPMGIYSITVTGPFHSKGPGNTSSRQRILVCNPATPAEEAPCVRRILTTLAHKAYRHPPTPAEMQELMTAYERGRKGGGFEAGLGPAIRRMLMDPAFLFRIELDPPNAAPGRPYRISDLELATRLSFFLWSSLPDEELLKVAESGQLKDSAVLEREVRRMLADRRARSLVTNFASEWLGLRVVAGVQPDPVIFSDFDGLKEAFQKETELLLSEVLLSDRSVMELLNGNYTYVNERLAKHYGIPNIYGDRFRRVTITDGIRGGLLGQGGILTATSYPNRTSPVLRGKWVLDNLLGSPPPPPPPNVPPFPEADGNARVLSVRERLAEHRKNAVCASCHVRMDPLGLALENFDATGKWRSGEPAALGDLTVQPIDASGQLTDGTKFEGVTGLRRVLQDHSEEFVYTMTERLLTYGLGRGTEWFDQPAIRAAVRAAKADDYRFSALVLNLVKSPPFRMRMALDAESGRAAVHPPQAAVARN